MISQRLVGDEPSRRRFETEARAVSALNHPAVVTIYDVGESDGVSWMAMELVEDTHSATRSRRAPCRSGRPGRSPGSLPKGWPPRTPRGSSTAIETRERDVDRRGAVKILDFGVARQVVAAAPGGASSVPTVTGGETVVGAILGTVGHMSPEQATGQIADFRSDQFSFGAVVYELLSGQRAFHRPTAIETLSAILRDEPPPLASIRSDASDAFRRVIARCLEKQPAQRFESTRELAAALEALTPESTGAVAPVAKASPRRLSARRVLMLAAAVVAAVAAGVFLWNRWKVERARRSRRSPCFRSTTPNTIPKSITSPTA